MTDEIDREALRRKRLRERLTQLNRKPLAHKRPVTSPVDDVRQSLQKQKKIRERPGVATPIHYRRDLPRQSSLPSSPEPNRGPKVLLEDAVDGIEVRHQRGAGYLVKSRADGQDQIGPVSTTFKARMSSPESSLYHRVSRVCDLETMAPSDIIFLDLETTGLGSSPLFLIGIMVWDGDGFEVRQYFARHYAEEPAIIALFEEVCAGKRLLVTFNGKSFDFPYVRMRAIANGIPFSLHPAHFDMLHECRRIWRNALPDCKLQTLENYICGRPRYGDIPGSQIPDAYHAYVRTADAWQMVEVLNHNFLDLVTMADLMTRFPESDGRNTPDRSRT